MGSEEHVCPSCGQPVETVVRRHKTLGTWVPRWVAGPCGNPECGAYDADAVNSGHTVEGTRAGETHPATGELAPPARTAPPEAGSGPSDGPRYGPGQSPGESAAKNS
ncbi:MULTISPECIES: LITAF-like zinc ribbon domain-containing protein [Streptomyces]|uniref:LITAF-like zinc ribbon domain-containing protein n=1 Tax=Streptomyces TaxID=1883 RepID=UPI001F201AD3|nr:LITAF-like zinc ribbon domain-containing protein [Streptomyces indiaensis]MCF1648952.1 LITAF-like zinc ribbon domain-containing protein [Streptomyces indiaensis]